MKKILFLCVFTSFATVSISAKNIEKSDSTKQYIITDCGTKHEIPADSTPDEACAWLDYYASIDC